MTDAGFLQWQPDGLAGYREGEMGVVRPPLFSRTIAGQDPIHDLSELVDFAELHSVMLDAEAEGHIADMSFALFSLRTLGWRAEAGNSSSGAMLGESAGDVEATGKTPAEAVQKLVAELRRLVLS